jgi:hypothetical protein
MYECRLFVVDTNITLFVLYKFLLSELFQIVISQNPNVAVIVTK